MSIKGMDVKQFFMKRNLLIIGIIVVFGMSFASCTSTLTCNCTTTDNVSKSRFQSDLDKAIKDVGSGLDVNCYDVEVKMRNNYGYYNVSCE